MKHTKIKLILLTSFIALCIAPLGQAAKPANAGKGNNGNGNSSTNPDPTPAPTPSGKGNSGKGSSGGLVIGNPNDTSPSKYYLENGFSAGGDITINGPVVIVSDGDFNLGNNVINITSTGSLKLYVEGDIKISGKGAFNNTGKAAQLQIWGTATEYQSQNLAVNGNGSLAAVVYAPNGDFVSNGGGNAGETIGSIIAKTIRFNGSPGPFHFDEDLMNLETDLSLFEYVSYIIANSKNAHLHNDPSEPTYEAFFGSKF